MLATLRIWRWTIREGIGEWPWQKPQDILANWKWTYNRYGGKELFNQILNRTWSELRWHLHTRHQRWMKRELRMTYLESAIWSTESLARYYEEKAEELENADIHK